MFTLGRADNLVGHIATALGGHPTNQPTNRSTTADHHVFDAARDDDRTDQRRRRAASAQEGRELGNPLHQRHFALDSQQIGPRLFIDLAAVRPWCVPFGGFGDHMATFAR